MSDQKELKKSSRKRSSQTVLNGHEVKHSRISRANNNSHSHSSRRSYNINLDILPVDANVNSTLSNVNVGIDDSVSETDLKDEKTLFLLSLDPALLDQIPNDKWDSLAPYIIQHTIYEPNEALAQKILEKIEAILDYLDDCEDTTPIEKSRKTILLKLVALMDQTHDRNQLLHQLAQDIVKKYDQMNKVLQDITGSR